LKLQKENSINLVPISTKEILAEGVSIVDSIIYDNIFDHRKIDFPDSKFLLGVHNKENIAASYAASRIVGVSPENIISCIKTFEGLPHRIQYIGSIGAINFYNDSKATNAEAASKSISSLDNIYWLAGGIAKDGGIQELQPLFHKIHKAYLFGQDKGLFAKTLKGQVEFQICHDLSEAFDAAYKDAARGLTNKANILLAPACASYDQFKNYEERGRKFIELYNKNRS
jgi:UDP-N-acetylmuramoylalanine--D-glutamate ligase